MKPVLILAAGLVTAGAAFGFARLADRPVVVEALPAGLPLAVERVAPAAEVVSPVFPGARQPVVVAPEVQATLAPQEQPAQDLPAAYKPEQPSEQPQLLAAFPRAAMDGASSLTLLPLDLPAAGLAASPAPQEQQDKKTSYHFFNLPMIGVYR